MRKVPESPVQAQPFNKLPHLAIALKNIHAFTRDQGGDIFELPPYSVDLTPIDTECSIVKRHIIWMSNIKHNIFRNYHQIWYTLNSDDLKVIRSHAFGYAKKNPSCHYN